MLASAPLGGGSPLGDAAVRANDTSAVPIRASKAVRGRGDRVPRLYPPPRPGPRVEQAQGATRAHYGQGQSLPELPESVRPPEHARPPAAQDTGQSHSTRT